MTEIFFQANLNLVIILIVIFSIDMILSALILYLRYRRYRITKKNAGGFTPGKRLEPEGTIDVKKVYPVVPALSIANIGADKVSLYGGNDPTERKVCVRKLATEAGWTEVKGNETPPTLSFKKKGERINVWYTNMTVSTAVNHPVKGKTQLYRRKVSMRLMRELFENPREHTEKGYFNRRERPYRK